MSKAADNGVRFIDTADVYPVPPSPETAGRTETIVGNWLTPGYRKASNSYENVPKMDESVGGEGPSMFRTRCAACHTIGSGDGLGPDLLNVTARRERSWLARYLAEPDRMLAEGDELAKELFAKYRNVRMPNLGLDSEEVSALLSHIDGESRTAVEQARTVPVPTR